MLETGAFDPLWADIHLGPEGAVRTFHALGGQGLLMPIHCGLFDLALHHWRQPIEKIWPVEGRTLSRHENSRSWVDYKDFGFFFCSHSTSTMSAASV